MSTLHKLRAWYLVCISLFRYFQIKQLYFWPAYRIISIVNYNGFHRYAQSYNCSWDSMYETSGIYHSCYCWIDWPHTVCIRWMNSSLLLFYSKEFIVVLLFFGKSHIKLKNQVHKQFFSWIEYKRQILANAWEYFCEHVAKVSVSTTVYIFILLQCLV